ncbi:zinc-finger homeodomain protein 5-like [Macadamia integrifolia]|uniref:zinc-finger homeodomain protein 5-like n=1 Tax=Macadamia integrifolia TaxID=60698 RepID=UPI001C4FD55A|nr:zinc-finger homeodomain protein 5-like [Macadamia integrifolia]
MENPKKKVFVYGACMKKHAAKLGSNATDGCGEFFRAISGFHCVACGCHQNFHEKMAVEVSTGSGVGRGEGNSNHVKVKSEVVNVSDDAESMKAAVEQPPPFNVAEQQQQGVLRRRTSKNFKLRDEQRQQMFAFATSLGWRMLRERCHEINQFCEQIGVPRPVFKAWLYNNKYRNGGDGGGAGGNGCLGDGGGGCRAGGKEVAVVAEVKMVVGIRIMDFLLDQEPLRCPGAPNTHRMANNTRHAPLSSNASNSHSNYTNCMEFPRKKEFVYGACMKNHAAKLGSHATDGCGEFCRAVSGFHCAACGCHQNFHEKMAVEVSTGGGGGGRGEGGSNYVKVKTEVVNVSDDEKSMEVAMAVEQPPPLNVAEQHQQGVVGQMIRLRRRTSEKFKLTDEQRQQMFAFATSLGWSMKRERCDDINQFCEQIGVPRPVFKTWLYNKKYR